MENVLFVSLLGVSLFLISYIIYKKRELLLSEIKDLSIVETNLSSLLDESNAEIKILIDKNNSLSSDNNSLDLAYSVSKEKVSFFEKQIEELKDNKKELSLEFEHLSQKILESQSEKHTSSLENIIDPFKEQLKDFRTQIDTVYDRESKDRSMLKQELLTLKNLNQQISKETSDLTNALKGDNKIMGNWGEMILSKVLEASGLRLNSEFSREVALKDNLGKAYRPDVIVHLPNGRDLIIDAKTSLVSYERYINSSDENDLKDHLSSIKSHIKGLSEKRYTKLEGVNSLDFIFMFLPIESSLTIALKEDSELFDLAYKNNIFLVSPSSLLIGLKTVENTWKHKKQEDNVKKIVAKAGTMYDKFIGFVNDVEKLGDQLETVNKTFSSAKNKLHSGNGSLTKQMTQLKEMGITSTKSINYKD